MKVWCAARISARTNLNDNKIKFYYNGLHVIHQSKSSDTWQKQGIPTIVRSRLEDVVKAWKGWEIFQVTKPTQ